jgi:Rad3-related DNA helicase
MDRLSVNLKLRNRLSEILINCIHEASQKSLLSLLRTYCKTVRGQGSTRIHLKTLSHPEQLEKTLREIHQIGIFAVTTNLKGNRIDVEMELVADFQQEFVYLCDRIASFHRVLSQIYKLPYSVSGLDRAAKIGALLFNESLYFECHELLEGFWRIETSEEKKFLQGIISLATALYHLEQGNRPSAVKLFNEGRRRLIPFGKIHRGLATEALLKQIGKIQVLVERGGPTALEQLKNTTSPKIRFRRDQNARQGNKGNPTR